MPAIVFSLIYYFKGKFMSKKVTTADFIALASQIHNNKFDYSKTKYVNSETKVIITCSVHGEFEQLPHGHLNGRGCRICQYVTMSNKFLSDINTFIDKANIIHHSIYDYSQVKYLGSKYNVIISCHEHGKFNMLPSNHLRGQGCPTCGQNITNSKNKKSTIQFIKASNLIHNYKFDYSKTEYKHVHSPVIITCNIHGDFQITPANHIHACTGCPKCSMSKGEIKIADFLDNNSIRYESQKTFKDCKHKSLLRYDFYLPELNILIEFDGIQHFKSIDFFGGDTRFKESQIKDNIKTSYATEKGIKLIRISYLDSVIDTMKNSIGLV